MRPIWVSGEGGHKTCPYNVCVGANPVFALPSRLISPDIHTKVFL
jgi:hypothetical protein